MCISCLLFKAIELMIQLRDNVTKGLWGSVLPHTDLRNGRNSA